MLFIQCKRIQVLSGDSIVLQLQSAPGTPPNELTVYLANIAAPRLARRPTDNAIATPDEVYTLHYSVIGCFSFFISTLLQPYAWEAREFTRKKIVGQTVTFLRLFLATSGREHGTIYIGGTGDIS